MTSLPSLAGAKPVPEEGGTVLLSRFWSHVSGGGGGRRVAGWELASVQSRGSGSPGSGGG